MKMAIFFISFTFSLLLCSSYAAVQDFCVADYASPEGPAGYSCKRPETVTADDFVYSGLAMPGNTSNIFRRAVTPATDAQFAALNGLDISMTRVDIAPGGVLPLHAHPRATEVFLLVQGTIVAGFISSDRNTVYVKTLRPGDLMVFPRGLLHFQVNYGGPVLGYSSFNSQRPSRQIVDLALFQSDLSTDLIARSTFLDPLQIRRLKFVFGGTN